MKAWFKKSNAHDKFIHEERVNLNFHPPLSGRLKTLCGMAGRVALENNIESMCDVGCDHALVPITLILSGAVKRAVGLDIKKGPLEKAKENRRFYLGERADALSLRLSDGIAYLAENEAGLMTAAGMGGLTIKKILEDFPDEKGLSHFVLMPHTKQRELRKFLYEKNFFLMHETALWEDGKYYPLMALKLMRDGDENPETKKSDAKKEGGKKPETKNFNADKDVVSNSACDCSLRYTNDIYKEAVGLLCKVSSCTEAEAYSVAFEYGPVLLTCRDESLHTYLLKRFDQMSDIIKAVGENEALKTVGEKGASETEQNPQIKSPARIQQTEPPERDTYKASSSEKLARNLREIKYALALWE